MGELVAKIIGWAFLAVFAYVVYSSIEDQVGEQMIKVLWAVGVMFLVLYAAIYKKIEDSRKDIFMRISSLEKRLGM